MKNSYVVKVPQLKNDILKLLNILNDANLAEIARNGKHLFERKRKLPLKIVIEQRKSAEPSNLREMQLYLIRQV